MGLFFLLEDFLLEALAERVLDPLLPHHLRGVGVQGLGCVVHFFGFMVQGLANRIGPKRPKLATNRFQPRGRGPVYVPWDLLPQPPVQPPL